ncbi:AAA family ATPase [Candidatus Uhrbacteria bacterium]|nr:AAA family ATPase [Candidatus Uhrbacteria bacterium]
MDQVLPLAWLDRFRTHVAAGVAHTYVFSLNVADYVPDPAADHHYPTLKEYLCQTVFSDRRIVVYYDRSAGFSFGGTTPEATARMEQEFQKIAQVDPDEPLPRDPTSALRLLERVLTADPTTIKEVAGLNPEDFEREAIAVIIGYAETIVPAGEIGKMSPEDRTNIVTLARWAGHRSIDERGNLIILLAVNEADLAGHLRSGGTNVIPIRVSLPTLSEREAFVGTTVERITAASFAADVTPEHIARAASGLSLRAIERAVRLAALDERPMDEAFIWGQKKETIERMCGGLIEVVRPVWTFDHVGGLAHVRAFLTEIADAVREGYVTQVPQGIIFLGPPGTGKTIMAEAFASDLGFPMLKLGDIQSKWVGESERQLSFVFDLIEEFAPVVVFEDEFDQKEQARGNVFHGDSGVSARMLARKLAYLSDTRHRGRILWIAASNRPDLMDPAMLRPGRFDTKVPFLLPTADERPDILRALIRKLARHAELAERPIDWDIPDAEAERIARGLDQYSGAEMELILTRAQVFAGRAHRARVLPEDVQHAVEDAILTRDQQEYRYMTFLALRHCNSLELLPEAYQRQLREINTKQQIREFRALSRIFGKRRTDDDGEDDDAVREPEVKA